MDSEKPPFWDDPEGEIIRWIVLGEDYPEDEAGYTKADLKERYLQSIRRTKHGFNKDYCSEEGFEKAWDNLVKQNVFWYRPNGIIWVHKNMYYQSYIDYWVNLAPDEMALCEELYYAEEPLMKRALQMLERPIRFVGHRYLAGRALDNFISEMIGYAKRRIIIVSPFVHKIPITEKLVRRKNEVKRDKKTSLNIVFFTKKPNPRDRFNYERNKEGVDYLKDNDVDVIEKDKTHAKILIVDDELAVVSSFNFTSYPTVGDSWESGIVTFDIEIIDEILESLNHMT